jgi:hypothetical protein
MFLTNDNIAASIGINVIIANKTDRAMLFKLQSYWPMQRKEKKLLTPVFESHVFHFSSDRLSDRYKMLPKRTA